MMNTLSATYTAHNSTFEACVTSSTGTITTDGPTLTSNAFNCGTAANNSFATAYSNAIASPSTTGTAIMSATTAGSPTWHLLSSGGEIIRWSSRDNMLTTGL